MYIIINKLSVVKFVESVVKTGIFVVKRRVFVVFSPPCWRLPFCACLFGRYSNCVLFALNRWRVLSALFVALWGKLYPN